MVPETLALEFLQNTSECLQGFRFQGQNIILIDGTEHGVLCSLHYIDSPQNSHTLMFPIRR